MILPIYLSMTAAEIALFDPLPSTWCYMSCHFSSSGSGLSNLPKAFPPDGILILDDSTPVSHHDKGQVTDQLSALLDSFHPTGVLLDFQRQPCQEAESMVKHLVASLPCSVAVSHLYAASLSCPVFLPLPPLHIPIKEHLHAWQGREIWMELYPDAEQICVTQEGTSIRPVAGLPNGASVFRDEALACHYCTQVRDDEIRFTLQRKWADLQAIQQASDKLGITRLLGLYQQLGIFVHPRA